MRQLHLQQPVSISVGNEKCPSEAPLDIWSKVENSATSPATRPDGDFSFMWNWQACMRPGCHLLSLSKWQSVPHIWKGKSWFVWVNSSDKNHKSCLLVQGIHWKCTEQHNAVYKGLLSPREILDDCYLLEHSYRDQGLSPGRPGQCFCERASWSRYCRLSHWKTAPTMLGAHENSSKLRVRHMEATCTSIVYNFLKAFFDYFAFHGISGTMLFSMAIHFKCQRFSQWTFTEHMNNPKESFASSYRILISTQGVIT